MDIHIRLTQCGDLSAQIYRQLLEAILDGRLRGGERLPATREFARRLNVARNTVSVAYERLVAEGALIGRVGAGTFVAAELPRRKLARQAPSGAVHPRELWRSIVVPSTSPSKAALYDFSVGTPDLGLFPHAAWRRLVGRELRSSTGQNGSYRHPGGHDGLRAAIARHLGVSRAVQAEPEDVIVTQGAQQAFDLIGRVLISPGTCVAVEDPGYPYARLLFRSLGARVVGVPVDEEGLAVDSLPENVRLIYVTPSHQFPLGTAMSLRRRTALLAWAERRGVAIIEDDYDSEFRFGGRPLDPLQSLDRAGRVIYVGSFSKVLSPALRRGFLIAPKSLQAALLAAKRLSDWHGEEATQAALARFIDHGLLARHLRTVSREYEKRYAQIAKSLHRRMRGRLRLLPSAAGLHVTATTARGESVEFTRALHRALDRGVRMSSLAAYYLGNPARDGLVLGFGAIPVSRIDEGIRILQRAWSL